MFEQAFKNIDDILWKEAGCTTELDYTEQTSWLLFLKYLDGLEQDRADEAALEGKTYTHILDKPYRWETWAAPKGKDGKLDHNKAMTGDDLRDFVNLKLFPYLHGFTQRATGANTIEYKIGQIFAEIKNKISSGYNLREIIDHIDELRFRSQNEKYELSHLYEAKIKNMGNAGRNGGEYYTARPLVRAIVQVVKPKLGETIYDGALGSAGFHCETFDYLKKTYPNRTLAQDRFLQTRTCYGFRDVQSALRRQGTQRSAAELSHPHGRDRLSLPPALHQNPQSRWPRRHRHQEHLPVQHRQRFRQPAQAPAGKLQPPHRPRLPRRHVSRFGSQDRGAVF